MITEEIKQKLGGIFERDLVEEIIQHGTFHSIKENELLMDYGKQIRFMPLIISGTIRVMRQDLDGNELLLYYLGSYESCAMAYTCCMEARLSEIRAVAEDNVEIISIPHQKLDEWIIRYPGWRAYIFSSFTHRFNELLRSIDSLAFEKLDERLVQYLKNKAKIYGKTSLLLSHNQVAEELGTNRVVISRLLKKLENERKIILYRNEIKLLKGFLE
jgi:CRP/FNR family transcriptional regulator, anaerobic regulatory protein